MYLTGDHASADKTVNEDDMPLNVGVVWAVNE